jgi:hypothetical protein
MTYGGNMVLDVIQITGGKGICFPDSVINALGINDKIVMETRANEIVITPVDQDNQNPRKGWSEAFKQMHELGEDKLYFPDNNYDFEWEW